jgi:hypothetical protein
LSVRVPIWWRDDDAVQDTQALRKLIAVKRRWNCPLALAVVPARAEKSLAGVCIQEDLDVLVHGFAHQNWTPPDERKAEFHTGRRLDDMRRELVEARQKLGRIISACLPVFVPPWNRFPSELMGDLEDAGYVGFSAWGDESRWPDAPGIRLANAHIDAIDWRDGQRAKTAPELKAELETLARARVGGTPRPIGILTHHLQMTDDAFRTLETFFEHVASTQGLSWTSARSIFRPAK